MSSKSFFIECPRLRRSCEDPSGQEQPVLRFESQVGSDICPEWEEARCVVVGSVGPVFMPEPKSGKSSDLTENALAGGVRIPVEFNPPEGPTFSIGEGRRSVRRGANSVVLASHASGVVDETTSGIARGTEVSMSLGGASRSMVEGDREDMERVED